jgi:membrane-associated phospholipid phosphatase
VTKAVKDVKVLPDARHDPPVAGVARPRYATAVVILGFVGLLVGLTVFGTLAVAIRGQELAALDSFANPFLHARASPTLDAVMNAATFVGSDFVLLPLMIVTAIGLAWYQRIREALYLVVALVGSIALNGSMKLFFQRPRPKLPWAQVLPDYSFPSGHAMNSMVFFVSIALLAWVLLGRRLGAAAVAIAIALVLLIGTSRIYFGYHYLTDVVGGYAAGLVWILVVGAAFRGGPMLARWRHRGPSGPARAA